MVADFSIKQIDKDSLHLGVLPKATQKAFTFFAKEPLLTTDDWYLAGGTALALQVGHRKSVDLDFFTERKDATLRSLEGKLIATNKWTTTLLQEETLYGQFDGAKMSFIAYPFFVPSSQQLHHGNVRILPIHDIAAMKIIAINQRGRKRDFVDVYWYCNNHQNLKTVIDSAIEHYPNHNLSLSHTLKSLMYFADAENDPMPEMYFLADWKTIKSFFQKEVEKLAHELLK